MIKVGTLTIIEFLDGDVNLCEESSTGTYMGEVYISKEELPDLIKALQEIQSKSDKQA